MPGRDGSGRTSTRGGGGASGAMITVETVLPLPGSAGTSSWVVVVCFSIVTSAAKAGPAQIRAAPAIISTRFMDHLRKRDPRSWIVYRMNRVHFMIIPPRCGGPPTRCLLGPAGALGPSVTRVPGDASRVGRDAVRGRNPSIVAANADPLADAPRGKVLLL